MVLELRFWFLPFLYFCHSYLMVIQLLRAVPQLPYELVPPCMFKESRSLHPCSCSHVFAHRDTGNTFTFSTSLCIPTYVHTQMCVCVYIYIYVYKQTNKHTYIHTYIHAYMHIYVCIYTYIYIYMCMYACMYVYMCKYTYT